MAKLTGDVTFDKDNKITSYRAKPEKQRNGVPWEPVALGMVDDDPDLGEYKARVEAALSNYHEVSDDHAQAAWADYDKALKEWFDALVKAMPKKEGKRLVFKYQPESLQGAYVDEKPSRAFRGRRKPMALPPQSKKDVAE